MVNKLVWASVGLLPRYFMNVYKYIQRICKRNLMYNILRELCLEEENRMREEVLQYEPEYIFCGWTSQLNV